MPTPKLTVCSIYQDGNYFSGDSRHYFFCFTSKSEFVKLKWKRNISNYLRYGGDVKLKWKRNISNYLRYGGESISSWFFEFSTFILLSSTLSVNRLLWNFRKVTSFSLCLTSMESQPPEFWRKFRKVMIIVRAWLLLWRICTVNFFVFAQEWMRPKVLDAQFGTLHKK